MVNVYPRDAVKTVTALSVKSAIKIQMNVSL